MGHNRHRRRNRQAETADALATGLGLFSIALGAAELFGARAMSRALGMDGHESLIRAYGVREVATGVAILKSHDATPWIWGRVGGDALDLATLAAGLSHRNPERHRVMFAMGMVAGVTVLDIVCGQMLTDSKRLPRVPRRDYGDRTGLPRGVEATRGAASDAELPADMLTPKGMRYPAPSDPTAERNSPFQRRRGAGDGAAGRTQSVLDGAGM